MRHIGAFILFMIRRAVATPVLLAIRFAGILVAVTLVAGVALYSTAMGDAMLRARLQTDPSNMNLAVSLIGQPLTGAGYAALDGYVRREEAGDLGLPLRNLQIHHSTSTVAVYRLGVRGTRLAGPPLASLALDYYAGLGDQIIVIDGTLNAPALLPDGDAPILVSQFTARSLGLRLGDRLAYAIAQPRAITPLMVAGIFVPKDTSSDFWGIDAGSTTYRSLVTPRLETFQRFAADGSVFSPSYYWQQQTDGTAIHLADANALLDRIDRVRGKIATLTPGTTLITPLYLNVGGFLDQYALLPSILLILVAPIVALLLYAVAVTTALVLDRQAAEIVLLRSRGATRTQVVALYAADGLALGLVAVLIGPLLGRPLAALIGHASGFLAFGGGLPFTVSLRPETYLDSGVTALLGLLAGLLPALGLARRSLSAVTGEQTRPRGRPLWQRRYLDLVMLAVALYGLLLLARQGVVSSGDATAVVAQDPLVAITPLLFAVGVTLLLSRLVPVLAAVAVRLLRRVLSPPAQVALHGIARAPRQPLRLVQLCALTLTLGIVAATVAGVQARNLSDQALYQAGAPLRLLELFDRQGALPSMINTPDIMPLAAHLALPGVRAATPALRYESIGNVVNMTDNGTSVNVLGVDAATAGRVMWYRSDFADVPFGQLLRAISAPGPNAIVSDGFLAATGLHRGDRFDVLLTTKVWIAFRVAGVAHYFPSLDPRDFPFVVANLSYLARASHSHGPNEVWLKTDQRQAAIDRVLLAVRSWPRRIASEQGLPPADAAQGNPLTSGVYGVVSAGFLIAAALALLGLFTYAYLTLHQRLTALALLRALGLAPGQVRALVLCEQGVLLGAAVLGGIVAGVLTTRLFLPYLPLTARVVPPFLVVMPWAAVGAFVLALLLVVVLVLSLHVTLLLRIQLGRVLRLGVE